MADARVPDGGRTELEVQRLVGALGDATRRRAFFHVRGAGTAQSKDDVAAALGIDRRLAAFHLDKLVDQGFLRAEFRRRSGRSGPGAGRPAKLYALADAEVSVTLPERHYDLLATLLLRAVSDTSGDAPGDVLERVGWEFGRELGRAEQAAGRAPAHASTEEAVAGVARLLSRYGFEARVQGGDGIVACACPFEEMAFGDPDRICALDRAIWRGVLSAFAPRAALADTTARAQGDEACVAHVTTR
jgi:predicted ArsR family transcriptional regulator